MITIDLTPDLAAGLDGATELTVEVVERPALPRPARGTEDGL